MRLVKTLTAVSGICLLMLAVMPMAEAQAGTATGLVRGTDGAAIGGARVAAFTPDGHRMVHAVRTDENGVFSLDLRQGEYKFRADAERYQMQWYDHQETYEAADVVRIPENGVVGNIDFDLEPGMPPQTGGIAGVVTDTTRVPIEGALVAVFIPEHLHPFRTTETRAGGRYLFEELPVGRYIVMSHAEGYYPQWYPLSPRPEGAEPVEVFPDSVTADINFALMEGQMPELGVIAGSVRAAGNNNPPIPGACVGLFTASSHEPVRVTETHERGQYIFEDVPAGVYFVMAHKDGFEPQWYDMKTSRREADPIRLEPGQVIEDINFLLRSGQQGGSVSGIVNQARPQRPIMGAVVFAFQVGEDDPIAEVVTDRNGHYIFERLPAGSYNFLAVAREFLPQWFDHVENRRAATVVEVRANSHVRDVNFDLLPYQGPSSGITGTVVTETRPPQPIPRAHVAVFAPDQNDPVAFAITDEHGHYGVRLEPGIYYAVAGKCNYVCEWFEERATRREADEIIVRENNITDGIDFTLAEQQPPEGAIFGTTMIVSSGGIEPLPRVRVTARMVEPARFARSVLSAENGEYEIPYLPAGRYVVFGQKPGYYPAVYEDTIDVEEEPVGPINLTLEEIVTGYMSGHVYSAEDSSAIWHGRVLAVNTENPRIHRITDTRRDGSYVFDALPEGYYHVRAMAEGFLPQVYPDTVGVFENSPAENIDFYLEPVEPGTIAGTVTDADTNEPIEGALIHAGLMHGARGNRAISGEDGTYLLENLVPGYYHLIAVARGYEPARYPDSVFLENGGSVEDIDFQLVPREGGGGHIGGRVVEAGSGNPISYAGVIAYGPADINGRPSFKELTFTDGEGYYSFDNLTEGIEYRIYADEQYHTGQFYEGALDWNQATPIIPDADNINFELAANNGFLNIGGLVLDRNGAVSGAVVYATDEDGNTYATSTDDYGAFLFNDLMPGVYRISAADFSYTGQCSENVDIIFNDYIGAEVVLDSPTGIDDPEAAMPIATGLKGNYPNPFNATTSISFDLAAAGDVSLKVYNLSGQLVETLIDDRMDAGSHVITWDASSYSSGIYFYKLTTANKVFTKRMTLLK
jgi:hypothetical protein